MTTRLRYDERRQQILEGAILLSKRIGYRNIEQKSVAKFINISPALITYYFTMDKLKSEIVKCAIKDKIYEIIAQGVTSNDPAFSKLDKKTREDAVYLSL